MATKQLLHPPVFKYDPANMPDLEEKIKRWDDYDQVPEIELKKCIFGEDAILELPKVLKALAPNGTDEVILIMDKVPYKRDGVLLKPMVKAMLADAGFEVHLVELAGDENGIVHPDFHEVDYVKSQLKSGAVVATLGSGVLSDITKHASFYFDKEHPDQPHIPVVLCMTANSVPAPASRMAIISKDGVKRTWPSRLSDVIIADYKILADAPLEYTMGGIGDMCSMFPAFADWYLGEYFGMGRVFWGSWFILENVKTLMFQYADEIGRRTPLGMEVLSKILTLGGLTMTYARESSPVSGFEHVVSHMLDMGAPFWGRQIANHGSQVAVAAIPALIGLNWLLDHFDPSQVDVDKCFPSFDAMEKRVRSTFDALDPTGSMANECWSDYNQKLTGWHAAKSKFTEFLREWPEHRDFIRSITIDVESYVKALKVAGHPLLFNELNIPVSEEQARWAYHNAHLMRKRFSSGDLINYLGWFTEEWTDRVFARMYQLVDEVRN